MTTAQKAFEFIQSEIKNGKTVYITTMLIAIKVTPKTFSKWEAAGKPLFFIDSTGDLRIRSGNKSNVICCKNVLLTGIKSI